MGHAGAGEQMGWGPGTTVSISRLPGPDVPMARAIGIGELTTRLEVGCPVGLRLDAGHGGRMLTATTILRIEAVGPSTLRIATRNHRYELRRVEASVTGRALAGERPAATNAEVAAEAAEPRAERTQIVAVESWPAATPGRFATGARVQLVHEQGGQRRELGPAILLVDLVPGENASFGVEGRVVATSAVREVVECGKRTIRIVTANSVYELELSEEAGEPGHG